MRTSDGTPINALRGLLDFISRLVGGYAPSHLVCCWDNDWRPKWRVDLIPSYKAHRVAQEVAEDEWEEEVPDPLEAQIPVIVDALAALGIPRLGSDGYEADDVIGTLATAAHGVRAVDVVTGDRDLFQLVDDAHQDRVIYTSRGGVRNADVVDEAFLREKYAVPNGDAYADMSILRGDTSDGLPGVAGIGEKTAAALIERYGDLAGLRAAVDGGDPSIKGAQRTRLEAASAYLDVAPLVVRVAHDAPLPRADVALPTKVADARLLSKVASEYGVTSSFNRVLSAFGID
jgi:5'-3' exonuclease